jgi:hypothetical protein
LLLLLVIPFTAAYRAQVRTASASLARAQAAALVPSTAEDVVTDVAPPDVTSGVSYLAQGFREIIAATIVVQDNPSAAPYANPVQVPEAVAAGLIPAYCGPASRSSTPTTSSAWSITTSHPGR